MAKTKSHRDVDFVVTVDNKPDQVCTTWADAATTAVSVAASGREVTIDVVIFSEDGAAWYGGGRAVDKFYESPQRSVFDRFVIRVKYKGPVE